MDLGTWIRVNAGPAGQPLYRLGRDIPARGTTIILPLDARLGFHCRTRDARLVDQ